MTIILIMLATVVSTLLGGLVAFKYKKYMHIFSGLTAGTLLAIIFLEIIPNVLEMSEGVTFPLLFVLIGFIIFHILEKVFSIHHSHHDTHDHEHHHGHIVSRKTGAIALIIHSFFDGLGIAIAYKVSPEFGFLFAIAVIAHDFSDGFNTVSLTERSKASKFYLGLDALAPVVGFLFGTAIFIPDNFIGPLLGIIAGVLLYVCTSDVLPEAHCDKPKHTYQHLFALCVGILYIVIVMSFSSHA